MGNSIGAAIAAALPEQLTRFEAAAQEMERVALGGLKVAPETLSPPERKFAETLLRHARGARVAAQAWRQAVRQRG